ncbi:HAD-IC family P-type ATPase [Natroniella sulfidigena]|uniref:HAD-IC family P-type ATPase n=1 Tax=Natroniella sulfidigena TaxID=723921 RepID=UPI00200B4572|nr:HAD-IC family P-type ATPase [Natroniella sulfidigena]MCK8817475.1 HAD-IC family P-type ATPase [Natroniella sulfidigena]
MKILSFVPGRIRLKIAELYKDDQSAEIMEIYLRGLTGIKKVRANPVIATLVVEYERKKLTREDVVGAIKDFEVDDYLSYLHEYYTDYYQAQRNFLAARDKTFLFAGIFLFYKIKGLLWGKSILNKNLTFLIGAAIVSLVSSYPTLNKIYQRMNQSITEFADDLLIWSGILLTLLRESTGLVFLFLKSITSLIGEYSNLQLQQVLLRSDRNRLELVWYNHKQQEYLLPLKEVESGDLLSFYEEEMILVTGTIKEGTAIVSLSYRTGQPEVKELKEGAKVAQGMLLLAGEIKVEVDQVSIEREVKSEQVKMQLREEVDTYQQQSLYTVFSLAICSYLITGALVGPLSVLLIMSPSATEVALNAGLAKYAKLLLKNNIMLKDVNKVEKIITVDNIVFDKTGTLTSGRLEVVEMELSDDAYCYEDLKLVCQQRFDLVEQDRITSMTPAKNAELLLVKELKFVGQYLIVDIGTADKLIGKVRLREQLCSGSKEVIAQLKRRGMKVELLSGDRIANVEHIAHQLEIEEYHGELTAQDKMDQIINKNRNTIMLGDGINDLAAMERSDLGLTFNQSECKEVVASADCILLDKDLNLLSKLLVLSEESYRQIRFNIVVGQGFSLLLGSIALFGAINPFLAKSLSTLNSILAILNSARILQIDPKSIVDDKSEGVDLDQENIQLIER